MNNEGATDVLLEFLSDSKWHSMNEVGNVLKGLSSDKLKLLIEHLVKYCFIRLGETVNGEVVEVARGEATSECIAMLNEKSQTMVKLTSDMQKFMTEIKKVETEASCRDCLLVKVDDPSGGDIDGCLRDDIIDELLSQYYGGKAISPETLDRIEELRCQEDESGFMPWKNLFHPKNPEEFRKLNDLFFEARERAYNQTKAKLRKKIERGLSETELGRKIIGKGNQGV